VWLVFFFDKEKTGDYLNEQARQNALELKVTFEEIKNEMRSEMMAGAESTKFPDYVIEDILSKLDSFPES